MTQGMVINNQGDKGMKKRQTHREKWGSGGLGSGGEATAHWKLSVFIIDN